MPQRGMSLGTVLAVGFACMLIAFTVACLCTFQLSVTSQSESGEQALHLAEGAIAMTVTFIHDGLVSGTPYGTNGQKVNFYLDPNNPSADHRGQVSFDPATAWGYSTNDYDGSHTTGWNNTPVPQNTVHIVALGTVGQTTRKLEVLVGEPPFQYVLAVDGALNTSGPLTVKAASSMMALQADPTLSNGATQGANVGSNTSVSAGGGSYVTGDVVCPGVISLGSASTVLGVVRNGSVTTPAIDVTQYDNGSNVGITNWPSGSMTGPATVQVNTHVTGPLTVGGDLVLQGATLYVDGDLTVGSSATPGGVTGTGAVFVHGNVTLNGGATLDANNLVALLASGNVTLNGGGTSEYFQGLVYTQGAFSASNITVAGSFVAHGDSSSLSLGPNAQVVFVPAATNIASTPHTDTVTKVAPLFWWTSDFLNSSMNCWQWQAGNTAFGGTGDPTAGGWSPSILTGAETNAWAPTNPSDAALLQAVTAGMSNNATYQKFCVLSPAELASLPDPLPSEAFSFSGVGQSRYIIGASGNYDAVFVKAIQYDAATNQFVAVVPPQIYYDQQSNPSSNEMIAAKRMFGGSDSKLGTHETNTTLTAAQFDQDVGQPTTGACWGQVNSPGITSSQIAAAMIQAQAIYMNTANGLLTRTGTTSTTSSVPSLNLNQFLSPPPSEPLQILSWRQIR